MGIYINPGEFGDEVAKQKWLQENAKEQEGEPYFNDPKSGTVTLCWVDNNMFTAIGVAYDEMEFKEFRDEPLMRPKRWFDAPTELVEKEINRPL